MLLSWLPMTSFFFFFMVSGTMMALSTNSLIFMWMGLETNMISFIPLLIISSNHYETQATMKYFLIQATASILILFSLFMSLKLYFYSTLTFFIALLMKLGMPPCHFWLPSIMMSISWLPCLILATWQKMAPMLISLL